MAIISISEAAQQWQVDQAILYQKIKNGDLIMSARSDGTHGIDTSEMVKEFGVAPTKSKKSVLSHEQVLHGKRQIKNISDTANTDNVTSESIYAGFWKRLIYAGFWKRLVAYFLDSIILTVFFKIISIPIALDPQKVATIVLTSIGSILITWLYYSLMESSTKQGTLGKMALGIKVVDIEGNQISFWRATGRHFSKIVSSLLFGIGYLMIAFTEKKQALHDKMADCLVVNKNVSPVQLMQDGTATRLSKGAIAGLILLSLVILVGGILAAIIGIMYAQDQGVPFTFTIKWHIAL